MPRNNSGNKQRYSKGSIPAASDDWFDAFTVSSVRSSATRASNYRPSKFNTADLIRNIKEVNKNESSPRVSERERDPSSLIDVLGEIPDLLQRLPRKAIIQLVMLVIITNILISGFISTSNQMNNYTPNNASPMNYNQQIPQSDPMQEQQQYQQQKEQQHQLKEQRDQTKVQTPIQSDKMIDTNGLRQGSSSREQRSATAMKQKTVPISSAKVSELKEIERNAFQENANKDRIKKINSSGETGQVPGLLYYNYDKNSPDPKPLTYEDYPAGGSAIAILVTNRQKDVDELSTGLKSLIFLQGDADPQNKSPILVFNEGDLSDDQIKQIVNSNTDRPIAFPLVDFSQFPTGFDPAKEETTFLVKGRKQWGYYHMIRFWVTGIWKHPAIDHFETIMRIDSDSCFKEPNLYLPNFMNDALYYHSQYVGFESGAEYVNGLYDFAVNHMKTIRNPSEPRNFLLWHFSTTVWTTMDTLPLFRTNFEVSRVSFMKREDVSLWHDALTEKEPFGVYRYRWGDAVTRFLTASMFENQDRIMTIRPTGYFHKIGCSAEEVDEAVKKYVNSQSKQS